MSKYYTTVRHYKLSKRSLPMQHMWRHTLRFGRHAIATWTVTDLSPGMVANWLHIYKGQLRNIGVEIVADRNQIEVIDLSTTDFKPNLGAANAPPTPVNLTQEKGK